MPEKSWQAFVEPIPLHPHNLVLQVWLELGVLGAVILAALLMTVVRLINHEITDRLDLAVGYGTLVSSLVVAGIGFGAWQNWWLSSLFFVGGFYVVASERSQSNSMGH